jgi:Protein of unknown function (DUF3253)
MNSLEAPADQAGEAVPHVPVSRYDATILKFAAERGDGKSFCPSEVARALSEDWRPLLTHVRAAARRLAEAGQIDILRHGKPIEPAAMRGVIRLRLKQA